MKKAIALAGIETIRDKTGHVIKLSDTFMNNVRTWQKDHRMNFDTTIVDCRTYKDEASPMAALWLALQAAGPLDCLFISTHSDWLGLYLYSKIRKELGEEDRYVTINRDWSTLKFNPGATIYIAGCQAAGRFGKKWPEAIAQKIADSSGATVYAFASRSAQHKRPDGGYEQRPDTGSFIKFEPRNSVCTASDANTAEKK